MPRDTRFPAAPCPTCRLAPQVTADQLGTVVRCRGCGTRFRAAPPPPPTQTEGEPAAPPQAEALAGDDGNVYDDGYGRFDETHTPGKVVALATMHYVYCGLLSVCGILSSVLLEVWPRVLPGPEVVPANRIVTHVVFGLMPVAAVVLAVAGATTLGRRPSGRAWTVAGLAVAGLLLVLNVGWMAMNLSAFTGTPGETTGIAFGVLYQFAFWLGYLIPVGSLFAVTGKTPSAGGEG